MREIQLSKDDFENVSWFCGKEKTYLPCELINDYLETKLKSLTLETTS